VLQALNEALARAVPNIPAGLRLAGEPGIGKSRLLEQFQAQLDGTTHLVLSAYCEHYLGAQPLQPFEQLIRASRLCQQLEPHGVASTNELASSGVPRIDTCLELLANVARRRTLVLILDDWQWADDLSRLALNYLFKQRLSVFVVLAARTDADIDIGIEANTHHLPSIHLEPFTAAAAQHVITSLLPGADPFITQQIDKLAGGSPLFIEELCHSVAAEGGQRAFEALGSQAVWINSLVVSRVARLPPLLADLLRVAAVAGNVFPAWLFERLTGLGAEAQALQELTARDFLYPVQQSGLLRFKHALTRDAVYGTVSRKQRRDLHLRVAGELAAAHGGEDDADEALAYHYRAAGDLGNAARFAEAAGDKALTANALDRARAQYTASLQALDEMNPRPRELPRQWCRVAQKLGMACVFDPLNLEDGLALFERAVILSRETGEHDVMARAEYWLAYIYYAKGLPRLAATHCQFALDWNASTGDARLAAQINATLGQVHVAAGEYARALPLLDQAVQSKRVQSKPGNAVAIGSAYTLARKAFMLGDLGQFSDANACFEESLVLLGDAAHPVAASVQSLISVVKLWQGCWGDALSAATAGIEISTQSRSRYLLAMGRSFAACAAWMLRPDAAVLAALREPTLWIESRGGAISTSLNYGWLVEIATALGEHQEARRHGARLLLRARLLDRLGEATGCRAMAAQAARCGDARRSEAYLERADRAAAMRGSPREAALNQMVRAEIALSRRQHDAAEPWLDAAGEAFTRLQMSWHLQRLTQLRAG
jgi:tetratricopeptide (TPR) repeat protein